MAYIQDRKHFARYLDRIQHQSILKADENKVLPLEFYVEHIYEQGLADTYAWALKTEGAELLEEDRLLEWLQERARPRPFDREFSHEFSVELIEAIQTLDLVLQFRSRGGA